MIIDDTFLTVNEQEFFHEQVVSNKNFPWYPQYCTTTETVLGFSHMLFSRDTSQCSSFAHKEFVSVLERFCQKYRIELNNILRGALNIVLAGKYDKVEPHVDQKTDHMIFLMYLNTYFCDGGELIVYKNKYEDGGKILIKNNEEHNLEVLQEIKPKKGRIVCFDGRHYHSVRSLTDPRYMRVACVFNFN